MLDDTCGGGSTLSPDQSNIFSCSTVSCINSRLEALGDLVSTRKVELFIYVLFIRASTREEAIMVVNVIEVLK